MVAQFGERLDNTMFRVLAGNILPRLKVTLLRLISSWPKVLS